MNKMLTLMCVLAAGVPVYADVSRADVRAQESAEATLVPGNLRCEYQRNPLGLDVGAPRLDWRLVRRQDSRGDAQSAYQVQVATSEARLRRGRPDLWDTGMTPSSQNIGIKYAGVALRPGQRAYWRVRVWDQEGRVSPYSAPAWWEAGLLEQGNWAAKWIRSPEPLPSDEEDFFRDQPAPLFRREFHVKKPVHSARAYVSGLGNYELRVNGRRVGDHELDPAWTSFGQRVFYSTYDVTDLLLEGPNAVGAIVGNGWYNPLPLRMWNRFNPRDALTVGAPRLVVQLEIRYEDGSRERVVTDESWKTAASAVLRNSVYLGEVVDARLEQPSWDEAGFDAAGWVAAIPATEAVGQLCAQPLPPIRVTERIAAGTLSQPIPGTYIFDMGVNFAGRVRLRCQGPAGTRIQLRYGELLYPDGTLNPMTAVCGQLKNRTVPEGSEAPPTAWAREIYTLKGAGEEEFAPRFNFHGFRYVEVTGHPGESSLELLTGERLHSDVEAAGEFACSNALLNRIHEVCLNTFKSNLVGVQSDCPGREKFGYGGDIVATSDALIYAFDMAAFYRKTVCDFADAVRPNGGFTETAPFLGIADASVAGSAGPIGWGTVHPLLLAELYQYYGERALLANQYDAAKRWVGLLRENAKNGLYEGGLGDHETLAPKDLRVSGTGFYFLNVSLLARFAEVLGKRDDAQMFRALAEEIRGAFNGNLYDTATGRYGLGTQACQAFALYLGLVPESQRDAALEVLVQDIKEHNGHLTTGIFGTKYLLEVLSRMGRPDLAFGVVTAPGFPGWAHMLERGATTLWEHWEFSDNTFSHNHPMFGSVNEWLFSTVLGIRPADDALGFDKAIIAPQVMGDLEWARGAYDSIRGPIKVDWKIGQGGFMMAIETPPGMTAEVHVPASKDMEILEGQNAAELATGVTLVMRDERKAVYRVESGAYCFRAAS